MIVLVQFIDQQDRVVAERRTGANDERIMQAMKDCVTYRSRIPYIQLRKGVKSLCLKIAIRDDLEDVRTLIIPPPPKRTDLKSTTFMISIKTQTLSRKV